MPSGLGVVKLLLWPMPMRWYGPMDKMPTRSLMQ